MTERGRRRRQMQRSVGSTRRAARECIGVLGQFQRAAALGALVVGYLRPVAMLDKEEGCSDEKGAPNQHRCAVPGNGGGARDWTRQLCSRRENTGWFSKRACGTNNEI